MKLNKLYICLLFAVMALMPSCKYDDLQDDVDALKDRVTLLEEQVKLLNENMEAIAYMFDGKYAISKVEKTKDAYTLTLTNGKVMTLNLGSESSVRLPNMQVKDGKWVIEGVNTDIPVKNEEAGQDGGVAKFKLELDNDAKKYYYTVSVDGTGNYEEVKDENGQRVYVTIDDQLASDPNFVDAKVSADGKSFELELKASGTKVSLPIMPELSCEILSEAQTINVPVGKTVKVQAKIKGDDYVVYAPMGWKSVVGTPNAEGILDITLTAPAAPLTRVAANNMTDLTVMVEKDNFWAVDKRTVKAVLSPLNQYESVDGLEINGAVFSKAKNGEALVVDKDMTITATDETKYEVFFFDGAHTLTVQGQYTNKNLVFYSLTDARGTLKFNGSNLSLDGTTDAEGYLMGQNVIFDSSTSSKYVANLGAEKVKPMNIIFANCLFKVGSKPIMYFGTTSGYDNLTFKDCDFELSKNANEFLVNCDNKLTSVGKMVWTNNIFYSSEGLKATFKLLNNKPISPMKTFDIECTNNTFINVESIGDKMGLFLVVGAQKVVFKNNLLWAESGSEGKKNNVLKYHAGNPAAGVLVTEKNISYSSTWDGVDKVEKNPFEGGTFNLKEGKFVPNATYAEYGAKR